MEAVSLSDILWPKEAEFKLSNGSTYTLRPANAYDWAWIERKFVPKNSTVVDFLKDPTPEEFAQIIFRLIDKKEDFALEEIEGWDDEGRKVMRTVTASEKILSHLVLQSDLEGIQKAFLVSVGIDPDELEKLAEKALGKKKVQSNQPDMTGPQSSTSSPVNTDTPQMSSGS